MIKESVDKCTIIKKLIKEKFDIRKIILFSLLFLIIGLVSVPTIFASLQPIKSIVLTSSNLNFNENEPGAWQVTKNAKWLSNKEVEITIEIDSILKANNEHTDIILVLDNSETMTQERLESLKTSSKDFIDSILDIKNNKVALISFNASSTILTDFTDDKEILNEKIDSMTSDIGTSFYKPLISVAEIMKNYKSSTNTPIVLFVTDGKPDTDYSLEAGQYKYLKKEYPNLIINAIQCEIDDYISDELKAISDNSYSVKLRNLSTIMTDISIYPKIYDNFKIVDYIDIDSFYVENINSIKSDIGIVNFDTDEQKIGWELKNYKTGTKQKIKVLAKLKNELINQANLFKTNKKEIITSKLGNIQEAIESTKSPVLSNDYEVTYDANLPHGCTSTNVPEKKWHSIFDSVKISAPLSCDGYIFKSWKVITHDAWQINNDYFIMPDNDVTIRAEWSKMKLNKRMDGSVFKAGTPILQSVPNDYKKELWEYKSSITKLVFQNDIMTPLNTKEWWDVSAKKDMSVIGYIVPNEEDMTTYTAYIQGVGKVIANANCDYLFKGFSVLESIEGLEYLDTSLTTTMNQMFAYCKGFTNLDLSTFDTSKVTSMYSMFMGCNNIINLNLSSFNTSKVNAMNSMFADCKTLTSLNLSNFNTGNNTTMTYMFQNCSSLTDLNINSFNTSKVQDMSFAFQGCKSLKSLDASSFDTSNTYQLAYIFDGCTSLEQVDISNFNTIKVSNMAGMFRGCNKLSTIDTSNFNTAKVNNMNDMFSGCNSLTSINVSSFDTSQVTVMAWMFAGCSSLTTLNISNFNTIKVSNMAGMFSGCTKLKTLNLGSLNTSNVTTMASMFQSCTVLTGLDVTSFNTEKVTTMAAMFADCYEIGNLDLSGFNMNKVVNITQMFWYAKKVITTLTITSPNTTSYGNALTGSTDSAGGKITLNYTSQTSELVDKIIATKSSTSNVVKGTRITI